MTPLTSPSGCESCLCLSEKIAELELRIHNLYKIQEAEKLLDTIVFGGPAQGTVTRAEEQAGTASYPADAASPPAAASTPPAAAAAPAVVSAAVSVSADPWLLLGAKPKSLVSCSTPLHPEHWEVVGDCNKKRGRLSLPSSRIPATQDIQLVNRFDILGEDFPSLAAGQRSFPSLPPPRSKHWHWSPANFTPRPPRNGDKVAAPSPSRRVSAGLGALEEESAALPGPAAVQRWRSQRQHSSHHRHTKPVTSPVTRGAAVRSHSPHQQVPSPPSTLIIGDSIIRNVRVSRAHTLCFPGATVQDIADKVPGILNSYPEVDRVLVHVGINDIRKQQSELLYRDFTHLLNILKQAHSNIYVSGPTPTHGRGMGRFTRLLSLNTWLSSACDTNSVHFVDNFNLFWKRGHLFGADGLHLNRAGARVLSDNLEYSVLHPRASLHTCCSSSHHVQSSADLSTPRD